MLLLPSSALCSFLVLTEMKLTHVPCALAQCPPPSLDTTLWMAPSSSFPPHIRCNLL